MAEALLAHEQSHGPDASFAYLLLVLGQPTAARRAFLSGASKGLPGCRSAAFLLSGHSDQERADFAVSALSQHHKADDEAQAILQLVFADLLLRRRRPEVADRLARAALAIDPTLPLWPLTEHAAPGTPPFPTYAERWQHCLAEQAWDEAISLLFLGALVGSPPPPPDPFPVGADVPLLLTLYALDLYPFVQLPTSTLRNAARAVRDEPEATALLVIAAQIQSERAPAAAAKALLTLAESGADQLAALLRIQAQRAWVAAKAYREAADVIGLRMELATDPALLQALGLLRWLYTLLADNDPATRVSDLRKALPSDAAHLSWMIEATAFNTQGVIGLERLYPKLEATATLDIHQRYRALALLGEEPLLMPLLQLLHHSLRVAPACFAAAFHLAIPRVTDADWLKILAALDDNDAQAHLLQPLRDFFLLRGGRGVAAESFAPLGPMGPRLAALLSPAAAYTDKAAAIEMLIGGATPAQACMAALIGVDIATQRGDHSKARQCFDSANALFPQAPVVVAAGARLAKFNAYIDTPSELLPISSPRLPKAVAPQPPAAHLPSGTTASVSDALAQTEHGPEVINTLVDAASAIPDEENRQALIAAVAKHLSNALVDPTQAWPQTAEALEQVLRQTPAGPASGHIRLVLADLYARRLHSEGKALHLRVEAFIDNPTDLDLFNRLERDLDRARRYDALYRVYQAALQHSRLCSAPSPYDIERLLDRMAAVAYHQLDLAADAALLLVDALALNPYEERYLALVELIATETKNPHLLLAAIGSALDALEPEDEPYGQRLLVALEPCLEMLPAPALATLEALFRRFPQVPEIADRLTVAYTTHGDVAALRRLHGLLAAEHEDSGDAPPITDVDPKPSPRPEPSPQAATAPPAPMADVRDELHLLLLAQQIALEEGPARLAVEARLETHIVQVLQVLCRQGRWLKAQSIHQWACRTLAVNETLFEVGWNIALTLGDHTEAMRLALAFARTLTPGTRPWRRCLFAAAQHALDHQNQPDEAVPLLALLRNQAPGDLDVAFVLGQSQWQAGLANDALSTMNRLVESYRGADPAHMPERSRRDAADHHAYLAHLYLATGDWPAAQTFLARALLFEPTHPTALLRSLILFTRTADREAFDATLVAAQRHCPERVSPERLQALLTHWAHTPSP